MEIKELLRYESCSLHFVHYYANICNIRLELLTDLHQHAKLTTKGSYFR